jgi:hypothetical protein
MTPLATPWAWRVTRLLFQLLFSAAVTLATLLVLFLHVHTYQLFGLLAIFPSLSLSACLSLSLSLSLARTCVRKAYTFVSSDYSAAKIKLNQIRNAE